MIQVRIKAEKIGDPVFDTSLHPFLAKVLVDSIARDAKV